MAELTEKPPQTQKTSFVPKTGTAEIKLVITVAPHKDIWPQEEHTLKKQFLLKEEEL